MGMDLATYLAEQGFTDAAFAARVGVTHSTINRARRGLLDLRVEVALKIEAESAGRVSAATLSSDVAKARAACTGIRFSFAATDSAAGPAPSCGKAGNLAPLPAVAGEGAGGVV
jgi:DNA-binding transcriptional regulator YdaS (Cro superfamily)